ncbi:hypothetical protein Misp01_77880 [Microtetraspora sp. NBRC 13810]|uniref:hypothetical protein n=1 Tax=Microtetraspora sp. NBRC 13810 TaxID=3030990 RepID=UPI0024A5FF9A|nr:hypothetical protein [Microtetraspora sp. NBRC 13810]GLW12660.1 hypothetical protein Misp01_77880 [Microtetraspora sp. NBRC 13810]
MDDTTGTPSPTAGSTPSPTESSSPSAPPTGSPTPDPPTGSPTPDPPTRPPTEPPTTQPPTTQPPTTQPATPGFPTDTPPPPAESPSGRPPTPSAAPSPYWPPVVPAPAPPPALEGGPGSGDRVYLNWESIRELATLFDRLGDDVVALQVRATSLASTSELGLEDEQGTEFARWYRTNYTSLTGDMTGLAESNFAMVGRLGDFEKAWQYLEQEIIKSMPTFADVSEPPIPPVPARRTGA